MSAEAYKSYVVHNCLAFGFRALRNTERNIEHSLSSPYEEFFESLAVALGQGKKIDYTIPNSEVESFYNKRMSEGDFISNTQNKILCKIVPSGPGSVVVSTSNSSINNGLSSTVVTSFNHLSLLFRVIWDLLALQNAPICNKLPKTSGKQLWEVFLKLDARSELKVHVDDIVELILRIFSANGHHEKEENIIEWFCGETYIDFWSFFSQLTDNYVGLLQIHIVHELHTEIVSEFLKEGRLEKKGHVVHNWKTRWFVLTALSFNYFESRENLTLKGSVTINSKTLVQNMPEFKARPYRFRIVCGESKTGTEISAPDSKTMHDWIYTIRMAINIHQMEGRNFLHKYKQALAQMSIRSKGLIHSASADKMLDEAPLHRSLSPSKSVPLAFPTEKKEHRKLPTTPEITSNEKIADGFEDSTDYKDPPPLPPQRFDSSDVRKDGEVFDKNALIRARNEPRGTRSGDQRRHSSLEPCEVEHVQSEGGDYALISKDHFKKKKKSSDIDISSLLSDSVKAQLSPDSTDQVDLWASKTTDTVTTTTSTSTTTTPASESGYIQLHFHNTPDGGRRGKISPEKPKPTESSIQDFDRTKFGYSTVVFETEKKTSDLECAERLKQNKSPPPPPPKYDSGRIMTKITPDSHVSPQPSSKQEGNTYIDVQTSSPDLRQSNQGSDESPYVNVRRPVGDVKPVVPPRRGIAAPVDQSPPVPVRRTS